MKIPLILIYLALISACLTITRVPSFGGIPKYTGIRGDVLAVMAKEKIYSILQNEHQPGANNS